MHLAQFYKKAAKAIYVTQLVLGVSLVVLTVVATEHARAEGVCDHGEAAAIGADAATGDLDVNERTHLHHVIFALTVLSTLVLSAMVYVNPNQRWRQLRSSACKLESLVWQYRTRLGEFETSISDPQRPEAALVRALNAWRDELMLGADMQLTAFERRYRTTSTAIFRHFQHEPFPPELQRHVAIHVRAHQIARTASKTKQGKVAPLGRLLRAKGHATDPVPSPLRKDSGALAEAVTLVARARTNSVQDAPPVIRDRYTHTAFPRLRAALRALWACCPLVPAWMAGVKKHHAAAIDDYHSPANPKKYIELRLLPAKRFYQLRLPHYARMRNFLQAISFLSTAAGAALAYQTRYSAYVAVVSSVAAAFLSWTEFTDVARKMERYSIAIRSIKKLLSWWESLSEVDCVDARNITRLVQTGEMIKANEMIAWTSTARGRDGGEGGAGNDGD